MDFSKLNIPFLNNADIEIRAQNFIGKFGDNSIPIDIEKIIDLSLEINIVPIPGLQHLCGTDALIASSWGDVYVDNDAYLDERYSNRLRFSLAHEMGHFVLHKDIYSSFKIKEIDDFDKFFKDIPSKQYGYLETQANKFASYLLVSRSILIEKKNRLIREYKYKIQESKPEGVDENTLNSYLAIPLSRTFGVSEKVIEIALNEISSKN
jgi:hypothetical protein